MTAPRAATEWNAPATRTPSVPITAVTTMTPAIRTGRSCFDRSRLPRDEYARRMRQVETLARAEDLAAVVVVANAATPAPVVHLANLAPTAGDATIVVVPGAGAVLMAGRGGQREEPYQRDVTWIPTLLQRPFGPESVRQVLAGRGVLSGRLGIAGLEDQVAVRVRDRFVEELRDYEMVPVDRALAALRRCLSVRERSVLGELDAMLQDALEEGAVVFREAGVPALAALMVEDELYARGCRDVRLLVGWPGGSVRPLEAVDDRPGTQFACYAAAELLGYWAERAATVVGAGTRAAEQRCRLVGVVDDAVMQLRPGADPEAVARAAREDEVDVLVRGLGTELVDLPRPESGWTELRPGDVVSVLGVERSGGVPALESRTAVVGAGGPAHLDELVIGGRG